MVGGDFFSGRVTDFSSGVAAVSAEGEFAGEEIVHAEMEENYILLISCATRDNCVDA